MAIEAKLISLGNRCMISKINIYGTGNVASFFACKLHNVNIQCTIIGRSPMAIQTMNKLWFRHNYILNSAPVPDADLSIICVSDDQITNVCEQMHPNSIIVHTSGSVNMTILNEFKKHGVLYPLQSISLHRLEKIIPFPFLIESNCEDVKLKLEWLVSSLIGFEYYTVSSPERLRIHLAAVIANNFTNYFAFISEKLLKSENQELKLFQPLYYETIAKIFEIGPINAQTGPAKRGDLEVINRHLNMLNDVQLKALYLQISNMIIGQFKS